MNRAPETWHNPIRGAIHLDCMSFTPVRCIGSTTSSMFSYGHTAKNNPVSSTLDRAVVNWLQWQSGDMEFGLVLTLLREIFASSTA